MLVAITGFGSVWRRRFGNDASDPERFARTAFYNTTGVLVNGTIRTRPKIVGHARFNGVGGFNGHHALCKNESEDITHTRTERDAHSDLARAPGHSISQHTVDANGGQQQRRP